MPTFLPGSDSVRRIPDVNVRTGRGTGHGAAKGDEGDAGILQIVYQRLAFGAVGVHADIHRVAVIESPAIMQLRLTEGTNGQTATKL